MEENVKCQTNQGFCKKNCAHIFSYDDELEEYQGSSWLLFLWLSDWTVVGAIHFSEGYWKKIKLIFVFM